jgi:hypothetical protein
VCRSQLQGENAQVPSTAAFPAELRLAFMALAKKKPQHYKAKPMAG